MSGHSKWSTIKHKKGKEDAKRGKIFSKLSRYITVAAREGGGNPEMNATLAAAIEKAKSYNMPADNIDRAVKKGTGEIEGVSYERIDYEGYGPDGVAVLVEALTDNRNRAAAEMRRIFTKYNGKLGTSGSVAWMFERKGVILLPKSVGDEEAVLDAALEAGAEDMIPEDDHYEIKTDPMELASVRGVLTDKGMAYASAELTMLPKSTQALNKEEAKRVLRFLEALEESDDVQEVYSNFDIPDAVMEEVAAEE
ncbi:MAG: YebC/PmpR family DNA-binding transcriptional regulator [Actinomycetota bacterium]|nr:YebC/PmpR family DNA-binding transcriptional regulator [Actinomycetota bacterium]